MYVMVCFCVNMFFVFCVCECVYFSVYDYVHLCVSACVIFKCVCVYRYVCVFVYVCLCVLDSELCGCLYVIVYLCV